MINVLSVDLEDWYQTELLKVAPSEWDRMDDRVHIGTNLILDLLDQHDVKATFFILGYIARSNPALVKEIAARGHEIGCHGYWHRHVYHQNPDDFRQDVRAAQASIEDVVGQAVTLYRAPSWSISRQTLWALDILAEEGFTCDSSVQPFWTPLSGIHGAPAVPFRPVIDGREIPILEFPPTTVGFGALRIPFSGGFYIRAMPFWVSCLALRHVNTKGPGMIYLHPWELDLEQPWLKGLCPVRRLHSLNSHTTLGKLQGLLTRFQFAPLSRVIANQTFPVMTV